MTESSEDVVARIATLVAAARAQRAAVGGSRGTTAPLGELYACRALGLHQAEVGSRGYDAVDQQGFRVQIKSRAPEVGSRVNPIGTVGRFTNWEFDYALLVLLDGTYELDEIWKAEQAALEELQAKVRNPARGVRVFDFMKIGILVARR